jgi:hypothetical protein
MMRVMETRNPNDPAPDAPPEGKRTDEEPDPAAKPLKDSDKSELGGAKN